MSEEKSSDQTTKYSTDSISFTVDGNDAWIYTTDFSGNTGVTTNNIQIQFFGTTAQHFNPFFNMETEYTDVAVEPTEQMVSIARKLAEVEFSDAVDQTGRPYMLRLNALEYKVFGLGPEARAMVYLQDFDQPTIAFHQSKFTKNICVGAATLSVFKYGLNHDLEHIWDVVGPTWISADDIVSEFRRKLITSADYLNETDAIYIAYAFLRDYTDVEHAPELSLRDKMRLRSNAVYVIDKLRYESGSLDQDPEKAFSKKEDS